MRVFISYSHENDPTHQKWVAKLAGDLQRFDIHVILDQWDLKLGQESPYFMEQLCSADRVLIVCTPHYKKKADSRDGGAGFETSLITSALAADLRSERFVCLLRQGDQESAVPSYAAARIFADFRNDHCYQDQFAKLLTDLAGVQTRPATSEAVSIKSLRGLSPEVVRQKVVEALNAKPGGDASEHASTPAHGGAQASVHAMRAIIVADLDGFSHLEVGADQDRAIEQLWSYLEQNEAQQFLSQPDRDPWIAGIADRVIIAISTYEYGTLVEFAKGWVRHVDRFGPDLSVRVGLHLGDVRRLRPEAASGPIIAGEGVDTCIRVTSYFEGGFVVITGQLVQQWSRDERVCSLTPDPNEDKAPRGHMLYMKNGAMQHAFLVDWANDNDIAPSIVRLQKAQKVPSRRGKRELPLPSQIADLEAVENHLFAILSQIRDVFIKNIAPTARLHGNQSLDVRVALLAPRRRGAAHLSPTKFRVTSNGPVRGTDWMTATAYRLHPKPEGPAGKAFAKNRIIILNKLVDHDANPSAYAKSLGMTQARVAKFSRHARCYVDIPFGMTEGVPLGVVCIDVLQPIPLPTRRLQRFAETELICYNGTLGLAWNMRTRM